MAKQTFVTGQVLTAAQMTALQLNDYNQTVSVKTASYVLTAADAGTRITMSNAGATTITVNTSLFSAGDTLFITNIGAGACTITAGTATVSTASSLVLAQYDSGRLYFTSTGVAIWEKYQGAAASFSAGLTFISATTFTGVSTVSLPTNSFTSTYENYKAIITFGAAGPAGNPAISLRMRDAGTDNSSASYYYALQKLNTTPARNDAGAAAATSIPLSGSLVSNALTQGGLELTILKPKAGSYPIINIAGMLRDNSIGFNSIVGTALFLGAGTFDSLSLYLSSDTFAGTIRLYGFQNS